MAAAVLLPAGFRLFGAERLLLTHADHSYAVGGEAQAHKVIPHGFGAAFGQRQVVFVGAARVSVPLDDDLRRRPALQPLQVLLQARPGRLRRFDRVLGEKDVGRAAPLIQFIESLFARRSLLLSGAAGVRRGRWRRRRRWVARPRRRGRSLPARQGAVSLPSSSRMRRRQRRMQPRARRSLTLIYSLS